MVGALLEGLQLGPRVVPLATVVAAASIVVTAVVAAVVGKYVPIFSLWRYAAGDANAGRALS